MVAGRRSLKFVFAGSTKRGMNRLICSGYGELFIEGLLVDITQKTQESIFHKLPIKSKNITKKTSMTENKLFTV